MADVDVDIEDAVVGIVVAYLLALAAVRWAENTAEDALEGLTGGLLDV